MREIGGEEMEKEGKREGKSSNGSSPLLINYQYTHIISATRKATTCASCAVCNANKLWCNFHNHMTRGVCMIITQKRCDTRTHTHMYTSFIQLVWLASSPRSIACAYLYIDVISLFNKHTLIHFWFQRIHIFISHLSAPRLILIIIFLSIVSLW